MSRTTTTAKEYLSRAYRIDQRINSKLDQILSLRELATKVTATMSDMPRGESPELQPLPGIIAKIIDYEDQINDDIDTLIDVKREVGTLIGSIDSTVCQMLLEERYINFKTWREIRTAMNLEERNLFKLHTKALSEIDVKLSGGQ